MRTDQRTAVAAMLDARSVAVVGASARPDSFGARMVSEVLRSADRRVEFVNPRWDEVAGRPCLPSIAELDDAPDLVLLGVGDHAVVEQLEAAARRGARSAVIFGGLHAPGIREEVTAIARGAGMAVCGGGCMGFVNVAGGLRATGYVEREVVRPGPISLITHSGSVFSTLLRTRRPLGYRVAVSSGQELVTSTADYLEHVLDDPGTRLLALVLETIRDGPRLRDALHRAAEQDVRVVLLAVGGSPQGAAMVAAHSGAVAGADATWEALCADTGALRVSDLAELTDTLELLSLARRPVRPGGGLATVHDSGAERTLVVDLAATLDVRFAAIGDTTRDRLAARLDEGLRPENPLDLWGTGADTRELFSSCLQALADDPDVGAVALAVDLVSEYDGDTAYPDAVLDVAATSPVPIAVLTNLAAAIDDPTAQRLRGHGVPVLEGTRSGLVALRHLLTPVRDGRVTAPPVDETRRDRWLTRLGRGVGSGVGGGAMPTSTDALALLADYGVPTAAARRADTLDGALAAADAIGFPVVLKTDAPGVAHKSDVAGVRLNLPDVAAVTAAYLELSARLGPQVLVCAQAPPGIEISVGLVRDPSLGPLVVLAAGGVLIELLADRVVALPPVDAARAVELIGQLRVHALLAGFRGAPAVDLDALAAAVSGVSQLALELGEALDALDVNPLIASPDGVVAVDALVVPRTPSSGADQKMA